MKSSSGPGGRQPGFSPDTLATKRPKHVHLLDRPGSHWEVLMRLATDLRVAATNNGSKRDNRPMKIKMKVFGGLRNMAGAQAFARLRSYLSTTKQDQSAFTAMATLHNGNPPTAEPAPPKTSRVVTSLHVESKFRRYLA